MATWRWPELAKPLTQLIVERNADLTGGEKLFIGELATRLKPAYAEGVLSERELEVLRQLATGASNKEIGERLFISLSTVKTHVINIYSKLGAASRVEAVEKARSRGITSISLETTDMGRPLYEKYGFLREEKEMYLPNH